MATYKIDTPAGRAKLAPRRKPYFHKILTNRFVGFRYMTPGTAGTWSAKRQEGRKEIALALGTLDPSPRRTAALSPSRARSTGSTSRSSSPRARPSSPRR